MTIKQWPEEERPREKLLARGASYLSDSELLAIFLRTGTQGKTAVDLARDLLQRFGGLRALLEADCATFCEPKGLGPVKYVQIQASLEMARRHLFESLCQGDVIANPNDTRHFLAARLREIPHEVFACLFLDSKHCVLEYEELFRGSISGASVHPREVLKRALHHNAAAVIFAHNHPSGNAEPSEADKRITRKLSDVLALVDVRVVDHLIIGERIVSFAERGLL